MDTKVYSKMFMWLFIGLLITFLSGYCLSLNETLLVSVLSIGILPIIVIELVVAVLMGFRIKKMKPMTAKICYIIYSIVTGITFSTIFISFKLNSIMLVFGVTSLLFALLAGYGFITKRDITKIGNILFIALIGSLVVSIINIFMHSPQVEMGLSILCILIFMGYVAYDMNNIKYLVNSLDEDKAAVYGAFQLYLDFINIFIRLLQLFGKRND